MAQRSDSFDVIIIGAGHNGLSAAATLALKGKRVCVLERSEVIGGMSSSYAITDGILASRIAHLAHNINPVVLKELGLSGKIDFKKLPTIALSPDGLHVEIQDEQARYLNGQSHPEAAAYAGIRKKIQKFADLLAPLALRSPPDISDGFSFAGIAESADLAKLGFNLRLMGKKDMREFLRIILSNIYDLALDDLSDGALAGSLTADAIWGAWAGPRSPGTVFSLMYRYGAGGASLAPVGGMGAIINAFADVAKNNGAEIRINSHAKSLIVENDAVKGIVLEDGSTLSALAVMSSAAAFASMMIAGVEHFDVEAVRRIRNIRAKGTTAKVNLVLSDVPKFKELKEPQLAGRLVIAPSAAYVERAFNAVKYGAMAKAPVIEAVIPSLFDPTMRAGSAHVMSAVVQYIPYHLEGGWTEVARDKLTELTIDTISSYAPNIKNLITSTDTLTPVDIEQETGAPGGHWHHGELSTDQLLTVRPVNGMSRYAFGVKGFYLCGAGAHPGGDVNGAAGRNSALQLMKDGALA